MKKAISILLALVMMLSVLTACGGNETVVDENQTEFNVISGISALSSGYDDNVVLNAMQETAGIKINWETMSDSLAEQVNVRIAGGELPDAFQAVGFSNYDLARYGAEGTFIDLTEYITPEIMPNLCAIFNEKTFRYLRMEGVPMEQNLLEQRSTHGPFTSRLADRAVDFAILHHQGEAGVACRYDPSLGEDTPEFITTYFDWLRDTHGVTMEDPFRIVLYAHAANGGIRIDEQGFTGVPGLYAAGEITGGMHGADRIGGLSTANGLVFGARAGRAAAENIRITARTEVDYSPRYLADAAQKQAVLRLLMTRHALVDRNEAGLTTALNILTAFRPLQEAPWELSCRELALSQQVQHQLTLARCVLSAQKLRRESRGSHFRSDFPTQNTSMDSPILVTARNGEIHTTFETQRG